MIGLAEKQVGLARKLVHSLKICKEYSLSDFAYLLGVQENAVRGKGVLTRSNSDAQILLITLQKDKYSTSSYIDHLDGSILFWSGQNRIKSTEMNLVNGTHDTFIFIQQQRKTPYVYYGRAIPLRMDIHKEIDVPSRIVFDLVEYEQYLLVKKSTFVEEQVPSYGNGLLKTESETIKKIRVAQTIYRNNVIKFWNNRCAVTGVDDEKWLVASHIKPWKESSDEERVDPRNSLLLTPNFDKLFDRGIISFSPSNGKIILPEKLSAKMWSNLNKFNINEDTHLSSVPNGVGTFLEYHNKYVYSFEPSYEQNNEDFLEYMLL